MSTHRSRLLALGAINLLLVLLFPPFDSAGLGWTRATASFDAFYFAFDAPSGKFIDAWLLALEIVWLAANTVLAWMLLGERRGEERIMSARNGVVVGAALNLIVIWLLPPLENYASVLRMTGTYFDGFFLVFGDKWQRHFYVPLLYLEVLWLLVNAAALWLLCKSPQETAGQGAPGGSPLHSATELPEELAH